MKNNNLFVSNWKMSFSFDQAIEFATDNYDKFVSLANNNIVLCPSFEAIYPIAKMFKDTNVNVGAQNCSHHLTGNHSKNFTSQVSAQSLKNIGCNFCIIGHSESRRELCETDLQIAHKCAHLIENDISPILCIGENKKEYENKKTLQVLEGQLSQIFKELNSKTIPSYLTLYIAYEPIWSIGTGDIADTKYLETIFCWLAEQTRKHSSNAQWRFLYGGSVSPQNIDALKKIDGINGFLIGSASLDFQKLEKIVQSER